MSYVLTNMQGNALGDTPDCRWDFAAWEDTLKITANEVNAWITLSGDQLAALKDLLTHT